MRLAYRSLLVSLLAVAPLVGCGLKGDSEQSEQDVGPGGVEFVTVPVPGEDCDSIVLKGTRSFRGRAYVLPQAYVGVDAATKPLFEILPNDDGSFSVRLGIFFPGGSADDQMRADNNRRIRKDCTFSQIRKVVNENLPEDEHIGEPSPLLVNHIKANLPGADAPALIGHEGTDILSYVGQDAIVEFRYKDEAALKAFVARLRSNVGVQLDLDFVFSAQTADNVEATVDFRSNSDKLDAALGAGVPADGLMVEADFRARIASVVQQMDIDIVVDSSNDSFRQLADRVVEKMILDNPALQIRPPATPEGLPNATPTPEGQPSAVPTVKIKVSAALEALKAQGTYKVKLTSIGAAVARTYTAHTVIRSNFTEAGVNEMALYSDGQGSTYTEDITAGTSIILVPSGRATEDIEYHYRATGFRTKEDLFSPYHSMAARFDLLNRYPGSVRYRPDADAYMYAGYFNLTYYTWGFETLTKDFVNRQFTRLEPRAIEKLDPVGISFSRAGRLYSFGQLAQEKDLWDATIEGDENRITLTAKSDLGRLKLENRESFPTVDHPTSNPAAQLFERRYFQDYWDAFSTFQSRQVSNVGNPMRLPAQRSAYYVKVIPQKGEAATKVDGIKVAPRDQNGILHPPPNQDP
jgi:hypothetical protein